jgi:L-ascorbate metabolism protein UlaG (beta-lactamase superfamily)
MVELIYLGHSAFEITNGEKSLLIDIGLSGNHLCKSQLTDILVTHGHADHLGNSVEISKKTGAVITTVFELANYCALKGAKIKGINLGAWLDFGWFRAIFLPAFHSSSTNDGVYAGCATGILIEIEGKRFFHAGDTCLNSEMKVLKKVFKPDIALLPVGGTFTMDIEQASIASEWIGAEKIIPMHYNTFPQIEVNIELFKQKIEAQGKTCCILKRENSLILN